MRQPTSCEWARTRDRIISMSLVDRGPVVRARRVEWLTARQGNGWFYAMSDNFQFGAQADAFRQWMMRELVS